jgi:hypothetical protein
MEKVGRYNGNDQYYETDMPLIVILGGGNFNEVAIVHIEKQTGMECIKNGKNLEMQPTNSSQVMKLFLTYNFKTQYNNNLTYKNTLFLKTVDTIGFKVDHVCYDCLEKNRVTMPIGLKRTDRLHI